MRVNNINSYSAAFCGRKPNYTKTPQTKTEEKEKEQKKDKSKKLEQGATIGIGAAALCLTLSYGKFIMDSNQAQKQFSENPRTIAQDFLDDYFKLDSITTEGSNTEITMKPYSGTAYPTENSILKYNFKENILTSATFDIDGDDINEITVSIPEKDSDEKIQISYDYNDDGEVDFIEDYDNKNEK